MSRAIVLIGFGGVRAICISVMVIDSLLGKAPRDRLLKAMARAFHAAVQARNIVRRTNDAIKEEVFIASLLFRIGEMAFWACGGDTADCLEQQLKSSKLSSKAVEEQVLGTSLRAVTRALASSWGLGDILEQALNPGAKPSAKVVAVILGDKLSRAAESGWNSAQVGEVLAKVAKFTGVSFAESQQMAMDAADEAASVALTYGAAQVCHLIPSSHTAVGDEEDTDCVEATTVMQPDARAQLNILRELSNAMNEPIDVNTLFQMVIEGMHRGVGLERVCVAFIVKDTLAAKYVLGEGTEPWRESFQFSISNREDNIFTHCIHKGEPVWLNDKPASQHKHLYSSEIIKIVGHHSAFLAVVKIKERNVAVFYADRSDRGGVLDQEQFESFCHFVLQARLSLEMLSKK